MSKNSTAELLKELDDKIENVKSSEEVQEILDFFSKFHKYSYNNTLLIQMQYPDATHVAGYRQWKDKFNRHVKKGEQGIAILAPFTYTDKETEVRKVVTASGDIEEKEIEKKIKKTYFNPVYVFDISQTEGKPLPELDTSISDTKSKLLYPCLAFAKNNNISVEFNALVRGHEGYCRRDKIVVDKSLNATEKASVLLHELSHILLHHLDISAESEPINSPEYNNLSSNEYLSREIKELEAESTAYVVMDYFGVRLKSHRYLSLYRKSYNLSNSLSRIKFISSKMISFIEELIT